MSQVIVNMVGTSLWSSYGAANGTRGEPTVSDLAEYLRSNPDSCAEGSSISRLETDPKRDFLYLLGTGTPDGRLCVDALAHYIKKKDIHTLSRRLSKA